jgi:hypothetical protein
LNTETTPATPNQHEAIGLALARIIPTDLTEAEAMLLLEKIEEVVAAATPIVQQIIRPPPKPEMKIEIVADFMLGGVPHDVVLVHQAGEDYVLGKEAIRRAESDGRGHVVRSGAEWQHAHKSRHDLPSALDRNWLATARPDPVSPRGVSCLVRGDREWCEGWGDLGGWWGPDGLVLRRRT